MWGAGGIIRRLLARSGSTPALGPWGRRLLEALPDPTGEVDLRPYDRLLQAQGMRLPDDFRALLSARPGGAVNLPHAHLSLWDPGEVESLNAAYNDGFAPGLVLFGSDGAGEGFGFLRVEGRTTFVQIPFIPLNPEEACLLGTTLEEFLETLDRMF